jgi:hypothetical protein
MKAYCPGRAQAVWNQNNLHRVFSYPAMLTPEALLERSDAAAHILAHVHRLMRLGACFSAVVPPGLAAQARVVNYRSGTLVIHANNGAAAAKLRQLSLRVKEHFLKNGVECNQIELKVQPMQPEAVALHGTATPKPISRKSLATLARYAATMPETSPLAQALFRLQERALIE